MLLLQDTMIDAFALIFYNHGMTIEQTIEIPPSHRLVFDLPFELPTGRAKVELTVIPEKDKIAHKGKSVFGCLHRFADPSKIPGEEGAWAQAVSEKYAKN
jgi:hypothetical protein